MQLTFHGGAGTVTGSRTLVETGRSRVLVDCGLFQGVKALRLRNRDPFPVEPASIDAVVLTHAHIDHSGYLPALVRDGFRGPILCTAPTRDLCGIMLRDSAHLQEEDAAYANRKGFSRHRPALPLYTQDDAAAAMDSFQTVEFGEVKEIGELTATLSPAGHILGAASALLCHGDRRVVFSGDVGRPRDLLMWAPTPCPQADTVVLESTYGDRRHEDIDAVDTLGTIAARTLARGGVLLIPSFAVGRTQTVTWALRLLMQRKSIPEVPIFVNSPMATDASKIYDAHSDLLRSGPASVADMFSQVHFVLSVDESKALNERHGPLIIVSASGMLTGGRVVHHLKAFGGDPRNTILLPGFQAPGTRGAQLVAGAEQVKIHGEWHTIRAEVVQLDVFSAHADREELLAWLSGADTRPGRVLVNHGEPVAADALRHAIEDRLDIDAIAVEMGDSWPA